MCVSYLPPDRCSGTHSCGADRWCFVLHTPCRRPPAALNPRWSHSRVSVCHKKTQTNILKKKLQFDLVGRVDSQHSSVTHFLWRARATSELSFCFCLLLHGHLEPSNRNSARLALSPSLICSSLSFSPSHKHLLWEEKRSDSGPRERRIGRRVVSVNVKMPKQRARRMSWMVYGVWRSDPLSSPGFHLPALQSKPIKGEVPRQESGNLGDL